MVPKITAKSSVLKRIALARKNVQKEISNLAIGDIYARGLSNEGFAGGYLAALDDVDAALQHGYPSDHRGWWNE